MSRADQGPNVAHRFPPTPSKHREGTALTDPGIRWESSRDLWLVPRLPAGNLPPDGWCLHLYSSLLSVLLKPISSSPLSPPLPGLMKTSLTEKKRTMTQQQWPGNLIEIPNRYLLQKHFSLYNNLIRLRCDKREGSH